MCDEHPPRNFVFCLGHQKYQISKSEQFPFPQLVLRSTRNSHLAQCAKQAISCTQKIIPCKMNYKPHETRYQWQTGKTRKLRKVRKPGVGGGVV